jgi:hypothetical protein
MAMRNHLILFYILSLLATVTAVAQEKKARIYTVAFYNVENLFDTINEPTKNDEEFLPGGYRKWTALMYKKKLANIAKVLADVGHDGNPELPAIIGLAEVENRRVLEDLVRQPVLLQNDYGIVHFDSPDKRGIDVAFLYCKKHFKPTSYKNIPLIYKPEAQTGKKPKDVLFTRDQLLVTGLLDGEEISFIVNHWPSRSGGERKSYPYREAAAVLNRKIVDSLYALNPEAKILTMGDFNDGPYNPTITKTLGAKADKDDVEAGGLFNPMDKLSKNAGSVAYKDSWDLFDQIILSQPLLSNEAGALHFSKAGVYSKSYMMQQSGQYRGYPQGFASGDPGYSDHFPVYVYLIKQP